MQILKPEFPDTRFLSLDKKQARTQLIEEMNKIKRAKNQVQFQINRLMWEAYNKGVRGTPPHTPVYRATFTERNIHRAVFMARQLGGYDDLLVAAGYRAHK